MTTFVTNEFHAQPGRGSDVLALLLELAPESAGRPGCQHISIRRNQDDPDNVIGVTGTAWNYALVQVTPKPVAFGNRHVGDTVNQVLTVKNAAPSDGFSEGASSRARRPVSSASSGAP